MDIFEDLLLECRGAVERYVYFRISEKADADDILQETYISAYQNLDTLRDKSLFKAWIMKIARNKCRDYWRRNKREHDIPIDETVNERLLNKYISCDQNETVRETLAALSSKDREILSLYYFDEYTQSEIARMLSLPVGTIKSRLFKARSNFKERYPYPHNMKGESNMIKLPDRIPEYKIEKNEKAPFSLKWEEMMGWFIVPKLGEKLSWAMYDFPEKNRTELCEMEVIGKAEVHGIEGVEIVSREYNAMECNAVEGQEPMERRFVVQLTDTHCRILSESHVENGVRKYYTFLDSDAFLNNWGFGYDNCGNEVNLLPKGDIKRENDCVTHVDKAYLLDVVGSYTVTINGKSYDTVCVMDIETYNEGTASEQFIDENGKTVLWRRFNRDDWAYDRYRKKWSQMFPQNERITVNGATFVHWYDCITDYIL